MYKLDLEKEEKACIPTCLNMSKFYYSQQSAF